MSIDSLTGLIRTIPDFPKPGIQFRDVTTLLADGAGFAELVERLASVARPLDP
ncbi:MAG: adenine phosphoribosyltransferase, partial [Pseudomonadota bacterium]|nr:adenine phosphoribosyltransferase [Pseudomonadota bacterium]